MLMSPHQYQIDLSEEAFDIFKKYKIVYLAMEERTGKSLVGLLITEKFKEFKNILIITKKKALTGWEETLSKCDWLTKNYVLTNYHYVNKLDNNCWDAIILDEAHCYISSYPKRGVIWKNIAPLCYKKPIIYMSATPYAQGLQLLFNQFSLSLFSPWNNYKNFYSWYSDYAIRDKYGETDVVWVKNRKIKTYKKVMYDKVMEDVKHLFITKTRNSLGFKQEPEDILHYLNLSKNTLLAYNSLIKNKVLYFKVNDTDYTLVADSLLKLRTSLHMLEGGVLKVKNEYIVLSSEEKIKYILDKWGDSEDIAIMYQYIAEGIKLRKIFNKALILQSTSYAEGIDLSHIDHLIIYSQDFSTSKHSQRRARQANINRVEPIKVNFLLVKNAVSDQVYKTVSVNKQNFIDSLFKEKML